MTWRTLTAAALALTLTAGCASGPSEACLDARADLRSAEITRDALQVAAESAERDARTAALAITVAEERGERSAQNAERYAERPDLDGVTRRPTYQDADLARAERYVREAAALTLAICGGGGTLEECREARDALDLAERIAAEVADEAINRARARASAPPPTAPTGDDAAQRAETDAESAVAAARDAARRARTAHERAVDRAAEARTAEAEAVERERSECGS